MAKLLLIRHAQTDYNLKKLYCGFSNPPLNDFGIAEANNLAKQLKDFNVAFVYSSTLLRAIQTAKILFPNHKIKKLADLREINFGIFEGLSYEQISKKYPKLYQDFINEPFNVSIPKAERFLQFKKRVINALDTIVSLNKNKTVAVVTHSGPIKIILCKAFGYKLEKFWEINPNNAAFYILDNP
ncbi:MAG: histidine phosphatase family protein [Candidatus Omnitrophica bacterium]|nr:histidine phosphatase family protein [Candidatus Omnitrophota bacterium]